MPNFSWSKGLDVVLGLGQLYQMYDSHKTQKKQREKMERETAALENSLNKPDVPTIPMPTPDNRAAQARRERRIVANNRRYRTTESENKQTL